VNKLRPSFGTRLARFFPRELQIALGLMVVWEAGCRLTKVTPILLPPPSAVFVSFLQLIRTGELFPYIWTTLVLLGGGMLAGLLISILFTTLAIISRTARDLLLTLTAMLNPLPAIALLPLALLWFGLGWRSLLFVLLHSIVWSLSLNMYTGFAAVPETLVRVGRNLGLSGWRLVRDVYFPAALPYIVAGIKLAWAYSWRTVIAAELVFGATGGHGGLGWFIYKQRYAMETAAVFVGLVLIIAIGLLMDAGFKAIERRTIRRWGMSA
jgi:NitT/TauT family transport system permease protein